MRKNLRIKGSTLALAIVSAVGLSLAGCSSNSSSDASNNTPSTTAHPSAVTVTVEPFKLNLIAGQPLPSTWPSVPAPANATLLASGTATSELDAGPLLAAAYRAKGQSPKVESSIAAQMKSADWAGANLGNNMQAFEKGDATVVMKVVTESTGEITVFQIASTAP